MIGELKTRFRTAVRFRGQSTWKNWVVCPQDGTTVLKERIKIDFKE